MKYTFGEGGLCPKVIFILH